SDPAAPECPLAPARPPPPRPGAPARGGRRPPPRPGGAPAPAPAAGRPRRPGRPNGRPTRPRPARPHAAAPPATPHPPPGPPRPLRERTAQRRGVRHAGLQRHAVYTRLDQLPGPLLQLPFGRDAHARARGAVTRVEQHPLAGFGVFHVDPTRVRELALPRVVDRDRHHVVTGGQLRQRI